MKILKSIGHVFTNPNMILGKEQVIILRIETSGGYTTLSLSDDKEIMLHILVTDEIRKALKEI